MAGVVAVAAGRNAPPSQALSLSSPWFCHDLECPKFSLVKNMTDLGIELRSYPAAKWVSTSVDSKNYDTSVATSFWRLFKYISGNNEEGVKVEMTAPVTVKVLAGQGPACEDKFTVSFFVPFEHQASPPTPSDETVFIESRPALDVYVASFGGWAKGSTWLQHASETASVLEQQGLPVDPSFFYTAGYDSPFRLTGRHNEVWLPVAPPEPQGKEQPSVATS